MINEDYITPLIKHNDERGFLVEIFRGDKMNSQMKGQVYLTTINKGYTKGNHYHKRKEEWFFPVYGKGRMIMKDIKSSESSSITLDSDNPIVVYVPTNVIHSIENIGETPFYLLAYISECFDPSDTDTYMC